MREIKFRAWDKEKREMITAKGTSYGNYLVWFDGRIRWYGGGDWPETRGFEENKNIILMQYTGLKDSKGKEIYEGDIVSGDGFKGVIKWIVYGWFCHRLHADGEVEEWFPFDEYPFEVIGNIYEHPDLVKK